MKNLTTVFLSTLIMTKVFGGGSQNIEEQLTHLAPPPPVKYGIHIKQGATDTLIIGSLNTLSRIGVDHPELVHEYPDSLEFYNPDTHLVDKRIAASEFARKCTQKEEKNKHTKKLYELSIKGSTLVFNSSWENMEQLQEKINLITNPGLREEIAEVVNQLIGRNLSPVKARALKSEISVLVIDPTRDKLDAFKLKHNIEVATRQPSESEIETATSRTHSTKSTNVPPMSSEDLKPLTEALERISEENLQNEILGYINDFLKSKPSRIDITKLKMDVAALIPDNVNTRSLDFARKLETFKNKYGNGKL